jgi:hypothetical protein
MAPISVVQIPRMGLTRSSAYKCVRPNSGMALKSVATKQCPQLEDHDTLGKGGGAMCMKPRRDRRTPEDSNLQSQSVAEPRDNDCSYEAAVATLRDSSYGDLSCCKLREVMSSPARPR